MPKSRNQNLKIVYLYKILLENTDEKNPLSMPEIISKLSNYGINAERKSIYSDIELLRDIGVDIISEKRNKYCYYIGERDFQLAELKLLVDCVSSSKFITAKKSGELIKKLEGLASKNQARDLQRNVYITDRVKNFNEKIYYNVDILHDAINSKKQIKFLYYKYITGKEKVLRNNGEFYEVSPYNLIYSEENYYLLAHYPKYDKITHFRVDKMAEITLTEKSVIPEKNVMGQDFDISKYINKTFSMYRGRSESVKLLCSDDIISVVIDKFGDNVFLRKENEKYLVNVKAEVSPTFFGWIFMLGDKIKIVSPENVVVEYKNALNGVINSYKD